MSPAPAGGEAVERGWALLLSIEQEFAWSLVASLMADVTLFRSESGYGAMPTSEFDGDPASVLHEYDPHEG